MWVCPSRRIKMRHQPATDKTPLWSSATLFTFDVGHSFQIQMSAIDGCIGRRDIADQSDNEMTMIVVEFNSIVMNVFANCVSVGLPIGSGNASYNTAKPVRRLRQAWRFCDHQHINLISRPPQPPFFHKLASICKLSRPDEPLGGVSPPGGETTKSL